MWFRLIGALLLTVVAACGGSPEPAASLSPSAVESSTEPAPPGTTAVTSIQDAGDIERILSTKLGWYPAPGVLALIITDDDHVAGWSGAADLDGTSITPDTRFRIASITKPITAALVLDAVQRGELSLDDTV